MNLKLGCSALAIGVAIVTTGNTVAVAQSATVLPTGQTITPTAAPGTVYTPLLPKLPDMPQLPAGYAVSEALSPDGKTLLVLTTGYNFVVDTNGKELPNDSTQFVFVYDVSGGAAVQKQVVQVSNSFVGIAFSPDGNNFYVPGAGEDNIHVFTQQNGVWAENGSPIKLGHKAGVGLAQGPLASGIAVTADGSRAVVVNKYNDSVSLVDLNGRAVLAEQDLRPGKSGGASGTPGGEYPNAVAIVGNQTAYVSSERDREIVVVDISGQMPSVVARIPVQGNPNKMVLNRAQTKLFVASENADLVSVIDTTRNAVASTVTTIAPGNVLAASKFKYKGSSPNGLALSPDDSRLFVANRGTNSVAMIVADAPQPYVIALIPAGWYTSDVRVAANGSYLYVSNAKTDPGPNPGNCLGYETVPCPVPNSPVVFQPNDYILNITGSALLSIPMPNGAQLNQLTTQVAANNGFATQTTPDNIMTVLHNVIKHVIYIVKENRTYDQILGDLGKGNGAANLTEFPRTTTPNFHAMANNFVTLDNFYDPGDVSGNGWPWSTSARESDASAKMLPPNYAANGGGGSYDWEGTNRNINVGLTGQARIAADPVTPADPDLFPGTGNVAAPDGPDGQVQQGYLWNAALRAGLSVRNYGFFIDLTRYSSAVGPLFIARDRSAFADNVVQSYAANPQLIPLTDTYFRGFDTAYPDFYREREWEREFQQFATNNSLPSLSLVRFMEDHTGSYSTALDGVNRPDIQVADNDYAVGRLIQAVEQSHYAYNTLIFVVEDDAQDGPDHVDAHRSTAFIVGPYVKKGAVISTHYTTVNMLRTICDILGTDHLGVYDSNQPAMSDVFDFSQPYWSYTATASSLLKSTQLPVPPGTQFAALTRSLRPVAYWVEHAKGFDFSKEDNLDALAYNKVLWDGLMDGKPYPENGGRPAGPATATKASAHPRDDD